MSVQKLNSRVVLQNGTLLDPLSGETFAGDILIENGKIAERGTHDELIAKKGRYFDLFTYQAKI